jgi:stage II sporulation protein D
MNIPKLLFYLFFLSVFSEVSSVDIRISLYHPNIIHSVMISCPAGRYSYITDAGGVNELKSGRSIFLTVYQNRIWIRKEDENWIQTTGISFNSEEDESIIGIKPVLPPLAGRSYHGNLEVNYSNGCLQLINVIDLELYIMGVVETEAGPVAPLDFYKVQAIICRTYAVRNFNKHLEEGFNLCDDVHCQSYKGRYRWNEDVEIAVEATSDLIITDPDTIPIMAVYHSNSGGETHGAESIWLNGESYLKPVLDPFSVDQPNARWERIIPADSWFTYLKSKGFTTGEKPDTISFESDQKHRSKYYIVTSDSLEYNRIREDWNLKSSFFSVIYNDGFIILKGKGYGHGVGLSQEGAMNMARKGYHFTEILNFYYHNIKIINYREINIQL